MKTTATRKTTGPFSDPKVREKWQHTPGQPATNERKRKAVMEKPPFERSSAKHHLKINGPDGTVLYVERCAAKKGTIYITRLSFTTDRKYAAVFETWEALEDVQQAIDLLFGKLRAVPLKAHRNPRFSHGIRYVKFD